MNPPTTPSNWDITPGEDLPTVFKQSNRHLNEFAHIVHPWHLRSISNCGGLVVANVFQKTGRDPRDTPKLYTGIWVLFNHPKQLSGELDKIVDMIRGMYATPHLSLSDVIDRVSEFIGNSPNHVVDYFVAYHHQARILERLPLEKRQSVIPIPMNIAQSAANARAQRDISFTQSTESMTPVDKTRNTCSELHKST